ncbi:MAG: hypothetical protein K0R19_2889 [Bacillota bacterium]|jgi:hypothetical protein|nr:hypothetical protein [Bacillota bacterium]
MKYNLSKNIRLVNAKIGADFYQKNKPKTMQ